MRTTHAHIQAFNCTYDKGPLNTHQAVPLQPHDIYAIYAPTAARRSSMEHGAQPRPHQIGLRIHRHHHRRQSPAEHWLVDPVASARMQDRRVFRRYYIYITFPRAPVERVVSLVTTSIQQVHTACLLHGSSGTTTATLATVHNLKPDRNIPHVQYTPEV